MKRPYSASRFLGAGIVCLALMQAGIALANGDDFFIPASEHGHVDLVYFGHIKDTDGNYLDDAEITIHVNNVGITVPFGNDSLGHYRSPDIGAQIKGSGAAVDPTQITIKCSKKGYKQAQDMKPPPKASGTYQIDFVMAKNTAPQ
jgi:hypothetical protein